MEERMNASCAAFFALALVEARSVLKRLGACQTWLVFESILML